MYAELICHCGSLFNMDLTGVSDAELYVDQVWTLVWRFANAHIRCGFITSGASADKEEFNSINQISVKPTIRPKVTRKPRPKNNPKSNPESTQT